MQLNRKLRSPPIEVVKMRLNEFNSSANQESVRAFYLEIDGDYSDWVATIFWIVESYPSDGEALHDRWVELCELGNQALGDSVVFAFCEYLTEADYTAYCDDPSTHDLIEQQDAKRIAERSIATAESAINFIYTQKSTKEYSGFSVECLSINSKGE